MCADYGVNLGVIFCELSTFCICLYFLRDTLSLAWNSPG